MGHEFETDNQISVDATPEQVWDAIATGPGIDSWFMGRNTVEPREGGNTQMVVAGMFTAHGSVTAWEPPHRFASRSDTAHDGTFHAFEYLVEGRDQGSTVVRLVHSGFLGQDDWESEFNALRVGDPMYLRTLGTYLTYFPGRVATPIGIFAPPQPDEDTVWHRLLRGLGLDTDVTEGQPVRLTTPDAGAVTGVVDSVLYPSFLGVRTDDALYRFVGRGGAIGVGHHVFSPVPDPDAAAESWRGWLIALYA
jgi:uncharacterized protein YndB with AHSA1/START domain